MATIAPRQDVLLGHVCANTEHKSEQKQSLAAQVPEEE